MIIEKSGIRNASAFQQLNEDVRRRVLSELKEQGASHRQLERLTGVGRGLIQKL
jgi:transposase